MRKMNNVKAVLFQATFVASILLGASCENESSTNDTKAVAEAYNEEKFDDNKDQKDAQFLVDAAELNLEGIHLGQLAQKKGTTAHVKELGTMMVDSHTASQKDLASLAKRKSMNIPTSPTDNAKDAYTKLDEKSGKDFDKAYADLMIKKHEEAIETFEDASANRNDLDIKNWANETLPELRKHLEHSEECKNKTDKK